MKKDKFMLVFRIVQCVSKHMDISMTTFRKILYVLQCCEIDLGLKFQLGVNGPYTLELDEFHDFINIEKHGNVKIISVTNDFDISKYTFTEKEMYMTNAVYKLFRRFVNSVDAEMFTMLLERKISGIDKPENLSRYDSDKFSKKKVKLLKLLDDFEQIVFPYLDNSWFS